MVLLEEVGTGFEVPFVVGLMVEEGAEVEVVG